MIVLNGVEVWWIDGSSVLALQASGKLSLRNARLLAGFSYYLTEGFHSPIISASNHRAPPPLFTVFKEFVNVIESHNLSITKIIKNGAPDFPCFSKGPGRTSDALSGAAARAFFPGEGPRGATQPSNGSWMMGL
jgi:hypothetical protein